LISLLSISFIRENLCQRKLLSENFQVREPKTLLTKDFTCSLFFYLSNFLLILFALSADRQIIAIENQGTEVSKIGGS